MTVTYYLPGWPLVSQDIKAMDPVDLAYANDHYLPDLMRAWQHIEETTGYRWKCTSYVRQSETHSKGQAIDIAPDIDPDSEQYYSVTNGSDPVLYKRERLLRGLQQAAATFPQGRFAIGVFIEPDHLHIQVLKRDPSYGPMEIYKWKIPKPIYSDTYSRMAKPLMR